MVDIARDHDTVVRETPRNTPVPASPTADIFAPQPLASRHRTQVDQAPGPRWEPVSDAPDAPTVTTSTTTGPRPGRRATAQRYLLAIVRLSLGWIFLWAFLDKTFGLGHDTTSAKSWWNGGSPTKGFLGSAAAGPFTGFYHSLAGTAFADTLFMLALLGIGVALILGIGMRLAAGAGALLTVMMWSAVLPPASNPFLDDHLVYAAVLIVLALAGAGRTLGLGRPWAATVLVRRAPWLT